ncbi:hypothetical protein P692DRAFT_2097233 [Suillus brevipes Sb2]|nr:hypothetical protein P692DRAFT_2097233 [Suillus brevipes Sb2]
MLADDRMMMQFKMPLDIRFLACYACKGDMEAICALNVGRIRMHVPNVMTNNHSCLCSSFNIDWATCNSAVVARYLACEVHKVVSI